ncbi:transmembrane protein 141-like [Glandiceps talaboti]
MVLIGLEDVDHETAKKYPGLDNYATCQSKAFVIGMSTSVVGAGAGYSVFKYLQSRYRIPVKFNIAFAAGGAIIVGYIAASTATKQCQKMWLLDAERQGKVSEDRFRVLQNQAKVQESTIPIPDEPAIAKTKYGDYLGKPVA